jgi:hypothetical protein
MNRYIINDLFHCSKFKGAIINPIDFEEYEYIYNPFINIYTDFEEDSFNCVAMDGLKRCDEIERKLKINEIEKKLKI